MLTSYIRSYKMRIILGSASPRRKQLLSLIISDFTVLVSDIEEIITETNPAFAAVELAEQKATTVCSLLDCKEEALVIGADTIVFTDRILGKPANEEEAVQMLRSLSGITHSVVTGVCVKSNRTGVQESFYSETKVEFIKLSEEEIQRYVKSGEPLDKAGAYGIQGVAARFIKSINGCYYNVVGLPVQKLSEALRNMGYSELLP